MRYAVLSNNIVENVVEADETFYLTGKVLVQSDEADIGDIYENGEFKKSK